MTRTHRSHVRFVAVAAGVVLASQVWSAAQTPVRAEISEPPRVEQSDARAALRALPSDHPLTGLAVFERFGRPWWR